MAISADVVRKASAASAVAPPGSTPAAHPDDPEWAVAALLNGDRAALRAASVIAFRRARRPPLPADPVASAERLLTIACYGTLGSKPAEVRDFLNGLWPEPPNGTDWGAHVRFTVADAWLRLFRGQQGDAAFVGRVIQALRSDQTQTPRERLYLEAIGDRGLARAAAWSLVCGYHLAKGAETAAALLGGTSPAEASLLQRPSPRQLKSHLDFAFNAALHGYRTEQAKLVQLLTPAATGLVG